MELKKHKNELATRISLLDVTSDNQLAKELIELHEVKCIACQEDRLSCAVRPRCMNRNFLNALIEIGVKPQDLPSFCYSQYLEQIRRFISIRSRLQIALPSGLMSRSWARRLFIQRQPRDFCEKGYSLRF